jgi:hypothetical protein
MSKHKHKRKHNPRFLKEETIPLVIEEDVAHIDEVFEAIEEVALPIKKVITTSKVNIRLDTSFTSEIVDVVDKESLLIVTGEPIREWSPVETLTEPKLSGFTRTEYLKEVVDGPS